MAARAALPIVSLAPSATNILWELGGHANLVAVTKWCKDVVPPEAIAGLPVLDDCWSLDARKLRDFKPDLVIGSVPYRTEVVAAILAEGFRFLAKSPRTLADIYADIRTLAALTAKEDAGGRVIQKMRERIEGVSRRAAQAQKRPRIYCEVWPNPMRSCEPWVAELVEAAGGEFVPSAAGSPVTTEEVIAADPEIIVLAWAATGSRARPDVVAKRPGWENVSAIRENRIHVVRDEWLNTPAPILLRGLEALAAIVQPEIFNSKRARVAP
jgi:iron complex transport system substrate-binding protein